MKRRVKLLAIFIVVFFLGYLNEIIAPYFVNSNFVIGFLFVMLSICIAYILHLKDSLKEARKYDWGFHTNVDTSLHIISEKVKKIHKNTKRKRDDENESSPIKRSLENEFSNWCSDQQIDSLVRNDVWRWFEKHINLK